MTLFSRIIDNILTFLREFSYLLTRFLYEVKRPLILARKRNLWVITLEYITLRSASS